jgi:cell volume regulation protein A
MVKSEWVIDRLRIRRDCPGGLFVLSDGRYAVTGPVAAIGARDDVSQWAARRIRRSQSREERAWLQNVVGALASDLPQ